MSSADYSRVEISKQLIDPLAGAHAYSVVLNKDFVLQAPSHETIPTKPLVINTSSVNFPKSEVGYKIINNLETVQFNKLMECNTEDTERAWNSDPLLES